jgi:hypothetical protein
MRTVGRAVVVVTGNNVVVGELVVVGEVAP